MGRTNDTCKTDYARRYRDKYGMEMPTRTLAKIMYKDNPEVFKNLEDARGRLRYIEGKMGIQNRKNIGISESKYFVAEERPRNPYNLPESYAEEHPDFIMPKGCTKVLLLPDLHMPYHDVNAITEALDTGVKYGINGIILPGDVIDMHKGSKYQSDPKKRSIKQEFEATEELLTAIRSAFPGVPIYWQKGNHCKRWENYLLGKAPEIYDDNYFHLEDRLRLLDKGIQIFDDKVIIRSGNLSIHHGHLIFNGGWGGPVNPAKTLYDKTGQSFAVGHLHSRSTFRKVMKGKADIFCYTMGCLSEKSPSYNPIVNRYEHGFAIQEVDYSTGEFEFYNYRVDGNKAKL